jgi:hypothetical protein
MKVIYSSSKAKTVAAAALLISTISGACSEADARNNPGSNAYAQRTYQYAYYCAPNGNHDSTEVFVSVSNNRYTSMALNLTTAANGDSVPNTALVDPRTPIFNSMEFDARGNNENTFAEVTVSLANGFTDAVEVVPGANIATSPTRYTPTGYTHYKIGNSFGSGTIFLAASVIQMPGASPATVSLANFGMNATNGLPNVIVITSPATSVCQYVNPG